MKIITIEYLGVDGRGKSVKSAKEDAVRQIQAILKDIETGPKIIALGTLTAVIARTKHGWQYQFIDSIGCPHSGYQTAELAEKRARLHAAQSLFGQTEVSHIDLIKDEHDKIFYLDWVGWQHRYQEIRFKGYSDTEAHRLASDLRSMEEVGKLEVKNAG